MESSNDKCWHCGTMLSSGALCLCGWYGGAMPFAAQPINTMPSLPPRQVAAEAVIRIAKPEVQASTAPQMLEAAAKHMADRAATYDKPDGERSMGRTVAAFNAITGQTLSEAEGWLLLQVLKDVRLWQRPGFHRDSAEDQIAYSALKTEAKAKEAL